MNNYIQHIVEDFDFNSVEQNEYTNIHREKTIREEMASFFARFYTTSIFSNFAFFSAFAGYNTDILQYEPSKHFLSVGYSVEHSHIGKPFPRFDVVFFEDGVELNYHTSFIFNEINLKYFMANGKDKEYQPIVKKITSQRVTTTMQITIYDDKQIDAIPEIYT